ncbi:NAD(P)H-dependent oxidoreductase [Clostridium sp. Marseille-Q2269]|uniref:NAD(P)H-dependent oxidoreductase n=1 Tax=Clostridium sp. Marseille-Q2269 TaxID=2942205 RepID=UPI0020742848|nr:NAD(P)H-dependent oxidoreductase [Clostridium sp. Marseille-Q2269]
MENKKQEILNAFKFRYACKEFDPEKKVSKEDFDFILETARLSPSSFGFEPWRFIVVQDKKIREELKKYSWGAQGQLPTASYFVIILARKAIDTAAGSDYTFNIMNNVQKLPSDVVEMKADFYSKFQKNDFDLTDERKLFDWASKQTYIPLANMMSAAAQIGIDSCPMEGFDREKINEILKNNNIMDSDHYSASVMVAFGYRSPKAEIYEKTRQSKKEVIEWI